MQILSAAAKDEVLEILREVTPGLQPIPQE